MFASFISENAAFIEVLFGLTYFLSTLLVVYMNLRANRIAASAVAETQKARLEATRPYVFFNIEMDENRDLVHFELVNKGRSTARDIELKLKESLHIDKKENRTHQEMGIAKKIWALPPGSNFREFVGYSSYFFNDNSDKSIVRGEVTYKDTSGNSYATPVSINLQILSKRRMLRSKSWHDIAEEVENIQKTLDRKQLSGR